MAKKKVLVVQDENTVARDISEILKGLNYDVVGMANNADKAIKIAKNKLPDIVLMDIMLKGEKTGIDAASIIQSKIDIPVVFLTAYADEDTLNKAKIIEPYGYIIKPFKEIDLKTSIEIALYKHQKDKEMKAEEKFSYLDNTDIFFIKSKSRLVKVFAKDLYMVEALKDYAIVHTVKEKYIIHATMKDLLRKLPEKDYVRVHRSYIVRLEKIKTIEQTNIVLDVEDKIIPIGLTFKNKFLSRISKL